jgi:hypothetical protein
MGVVVQRRLAGLDFVSTQTRLGWYLDEPSKVIRINGSRTDRNPIQVID